MNLFVVIIFALLVVGVWWLGQLRKGARVRREFGRFIELSERMKKAGWPKGIPVSHQGADYFPGAPEWKRKGWTLRVTFSGFMAREGDFGLRSMPIEMFRDAAFLESLEASIEDFEHMTHDERQEWEVRRRGTCESAT